MDSFVGGQSIYEWLSALSLTKHYPLFAGYDGTDALRLLREADLVRLGVTNARDRRIMIRDLAQKHPDSASSYNGPGARSMSQPVVITVHEREPPPGSGKRKASLFTRGPLKAVTAGETASPGLPRVSEEERLQHQPWFHGKITRKAAERATRHDGDVLVRESSSKPGEVVLTTRWKGQPLHYVVEKVDAATVRPPSPGSGKGKTRTQSTSSSSSGPAYMYRIGGDAHPSVVDLMNHHLRTKQPISSDNGVQALYAVPRAATHKHGDTVSLTSAGDSRRNSMNFDDDRRSYSPSISDVTSLQSVDVFATASRLPPGSFPSPSLLRDTSLDCGSSSSLSTVGLGPRTASMSSLTSAFTNRNPDLPDPDLLDAMCKMVFKHTPFELAQHLLRVDMQMTQLLLPSGFGLNGDSSANQNNLADAGMSVTLLPIDMDELREMHHSWQAGRVVGLATVTLEQGRTFAGRLSQRFDSLSRWTAAVVIASGDVQKRCSALRRMVELAEHLQSDALADLFGFMAIMRGLQMPAVRRLTSTWEIFRKTEAGAATLFTSQLRTLADSLRSGRLMHEHLIPSVPYLEPVLSAMVNPPGKSQEPMSYDWEENIDTFSVDALVAHLDAGRSLSVQCHAYRLAGLARLSGMKVNLTVEEYFKRDFPLLLFLSRPSQTTAEPTPELYQRMVDLMSETAECENIIGKNTMI